MTKQSKAQQTTNQQENKMNKQTKAQRLADWLDNADCNFYDESSMWFDSRLAKRVDQAVAELRRLDALVGELVEALSLIQPIQCDNLHHEKKHRHSYADSCPVKEWIDGVLAKAKEQT